MPTYTYRCELCNDVFDVKQTFSEPPFEQCTKCPGQLRKVIYPPTIFDATPKTLGGMADRNSGDSRRYWLEDQRQQHIMSRQQGLDELRESLPAGASLARDVETPEIPSWLGIDKPNPGLANLTPKEKENYVLHGKTTEPLTPEI